MPSQQAETADTIAALKRRLKRDNRPTSDRPISQATNRGNKLKRGAQFVHQGALAYIKGPEAYKEKIEHAGYSRYILDRNPVRYNEYGEELDESESDDETDAWAGTENAYSGLKLEELLRPLTHPSELATHPTFSIPFTSTALPDMIAQTEEQLRREKANLECVKNLHRQVIGDEAWIPCEVVETAEDWNLFEPRWRGNTIDTPHGKKRKRDGVVLEDAPSLPSAAGSVSGPEIKTTVEDADMTDAQTDGSVSKQNRSNVKMEKQTSGGNGTVQSDSTDAADVTSRRKSENNTSSTDGTLLVDSATEAGSPVKHRNGISSGSTDETALKNNKDGEGVGHKGNSNGNIVHESLPNHGDDRNGTLENAAGKVGTNSVNDEEKSNEDENVSRSASVSPPVPTRRITRALAQTTNSNIDGSTAPSLPMSPSLSSSSLEIHPIFLIRSLRPDISQQSPFHLPPAEHSETMGLLTQYIQKQSAFVNTLTSVLHRLLQAERMRKTVFHWCKAEGHLGEMSDGEDWIDEAEWRLERGELKKGKGDEEDIEVQDGYLGRGKGKRRRGGAG